MTSYITINGQIVGIDFDGTPTTGFVPRVAEGSLSEQCEECGADIAETMEVGGNGIDTKRWIRCGACSTLYPLRATVAP